MPARTDNFTASAADRFASTLTLADIPAPIALKARGCLLYGLGIGLACIDNGFEATALKAMRTLDGDGGLPGGATALANGIQMPMSAAAFTNAVMMHGRCQEDTCGSAHLGVAVLPTLLALIEAGQAPATNLLPALVAGYEVAGRIEMQLGRQSTTHGFRASPLYGTFAAAIAAARAMDLSTERTAATLACAAAFAGGTLQGIADGTDEWRYQMGSAVRRGLEAAFLARAGALGSTQPLEGNLGFARGYARTLPRPMDPDTWVLPKVAFKLFPVCNRNQTAALLAATIHRRVSPEQIRAIRIRISPHVLAGMLERGPFQRLGQTLMSTYFSCAVALANGTIPLSMLTDFDNGQIHGLIDRMTIETDPSVPYPSASAEVDTVDGQQLTFTERKTPEDYSFTRQQINALLEQLAHETGNPASAMRALDSYAYGATIDSVEPVLQAYASARNARIP